MGLKELDILYENVLSADEQSFFLELSKYMEYILSNDDFRYLVDSLFKQERKDSKSYQDKAKEIIRWGKVVHYTIIKEESFKSPKIKKIYDSFDINSEREIFSSIPFHEKVLAYLKHFSSLVDYHEDFRLKLSKFEQDYYSIQRNYEIKKRLSYWGAFSELLLLKSLELDFHSSLNLFDQVFLEQYQKKVETIINGKDRLDIKDKKRYLYYLKRVHTFFKVNSQEIKVYFTNDLFTNFDLFKQKIKREGLKSIPKFYNYFHKPLVFVSGFFGIIFYFLFLLFAFLPSIRNLLLKNLDTLHLPYLQPIYTQIFILLITMAFGLLYFKFFIKTSYDNLFTQFLDRFLNGYVLLAIILIIIFSLIGSNILAEEYGAKLPYNYSLDGYINPSYDTFLKDNFVNTPYLKCVSLDNNYFPIQGDKIICDYSMNLNNKSEYQFLYVQLCTNFNDSCFKYNESFVFEFTQSGEIRYDFGFRFIDPQTGGIEAPFSVRFKDEVLSKEEYRKLELEKTTLFISLFSIILFSVLSAVVNLKKLTEPKNKV